MHLELIKKILLHCYTRQIDSGPESAFRFAMIIGPKRKHIPSQYPDEISPDASPNPIHANLKGKNRAERTDHLDQMIPISECPSPIDSDCPPPDSPSVSEEVDNINEEDTCIDPGPSIQNRSINMFRLLRQPAISLGDKIDRRQTLTDDEQLVPSRPYPRPRPIVNRNPVLLSSTTEINTRSNLDEILPTVTVLEKNMHEDAIPSEPTSGDGLTVSLDESYNLAEHQLSPSGMSGQDESVIPLGPDTTPSSSKRVSAQISPISPRQTRAKQKRKVITNDDLAAIEAQSLMVSTKRLRRVRRRG